MASHRPCALGGREYLERRNMMTAAVAVVRALATTHRDEKSEAAANFMLITSRNDVCRLIIRGVAPCQATRYIPLDQSVTRGGQSLANPWHQNGGNARGIL